jgi:hypothetical protein
MQPAACSLSNTRLNAEQLENVTACQHNTRKCKRWHTSTPEGNTSGSGNAACHPCSRVCLMLQPAHAYACCCSSAMLDWLMSTSKECVLHCLQPQRHAAHPTLCAPHTRYVETQQLWLVLRRHLMPAMRWQAGGGSTTPVGLLGTTGSLTNHDMHTTEHPATHQPHHARPAEPRYR